MKWVQLSNGIRMAYQEWGSKGREKILALHGWLDNSNSFKSLGPLLAENGYHVVAADHIGHGRSDHIGVGAYYSILNTTSITREFTSTLGWNSSGEPRYHVLGHSMGATISMIYAATFHENLAKLVMMEGFGPIVENDPAMTPHNFRKACEAELSMKQRYSGAKVYKTLQDAIDARIKSVKSYPGSQYISEAAAAEIVSRAVKLDGTQNSPSHNDINDRKLGPLQFTHDPRLLLPSYIYHSEEQVLYSNTSISFVQKIWQ